MRRALGIIGITLALTLGCTAASSWAAEATDEPNSDALALDDRPFGPDTLLSALLPGIDTEQPGTPPSPRVVIVKHSRRLAVLSGDRVLKVYRIELGRHPIGAKRLTGDMRTPEGLYRICGHHPDSRYHRGLFLDYPNAEDIRRALRGGTITQAEATRLSTTGHCPPPSDTALGGLILIHGQHPEVTERMRAEVEAGRRSLRRGLIPGDVDPREAGESEDWTLGCIALTNPDIRELFDALPNGTEVEIRP